MRLLAIETSCDDASVAIVEGESLDQSVTVLAERTSSQVELGKKYGGVFPELAAREHFTTLLPTIEEMLRVYSPDADPRETLKGLDAIAVTAGPGLIGSLLVGVTVAQALAMGLGKQLIPVNHLAGHVYSTFLDDAENVSGFPPLKKGDQGGFVYQSKDKISPHPSLQRGGSSSSVPEFPLLALTVSGGHTQLVWMEDHGQFEVLGRTRDDAAGEAFDKVSVMLGLGYPGGPAIQSAAADWANSPTSARLRGTSKQQTASVFNASADSRSLIAVRLPRPMIDEGLEFSFSGLKTAVRYWLDGLSFLTGSPLGETGSGIQFDAAKPGSSIRSDRQSDLPVKDDKQRNLPSDLVGAMAHEVQEAITDVLVTKLLRAAQERRPRSIILAGGVAANTRLREKLIERLSQLSTLSSQLWISSLAHSTDNGAMIGAAALAMLSTGFEPVDPATVEARSSWPLKSW